MPEVRTARSLDQVPRRQWAALFPRELEDYDYLLAVERAGLEGFDWRYLLAYEGDQLVAAAPAFLTRYPLETTLAGPGRRLADSLRRRFPDALTLRLACIGSPCTERTLAGFAPALTPGERELIAEALLAALQAEGREARCGLTGFKDVAAPDQTLWLRAAGSLGYRPMPGQPIACLDIDFPDIETYLGRLSPGTRRDMRRKLRARRQVRVEVRPTLGDLLGPAMALYRQTLARAEMTFEELTGEFFRAASDRPDGRAFYVLYFEGDELLAFNLLLQGEGTLLDKFFCMDEARGRLLNLYFLSWFANIELCLERGLRCYQAGQAAYADKLRLGCRLTRTTNLFRHRNGVVNAALRLAAPFFGGVDPTLKAAA